MKTRIFPEYKDGTTFYRRGSNAKGASSDEEENWENIVHRRCAAVGSSDRNSVIAVGSLVESKLRGGLRIRGGKRVL